MAEEQQQDNLEDIKEDGTQSGDESGSADASHDVKQQYSVATKEVPNSSGEDIVSTFTAKSMKMPGTEDSSNIGDNNLAKNESYGDHIRDSQRTEGPAMNTEEISDDCSSATVPTVGEDPNKDKEAQEANPKEGLDKRMDEHVDGPIKRDSTAKNDTSIESGEDNLNTSSPKEDINMLQNATPEETPFLPKTSEEEKSDQQGTNIETIGPTSTEPAEPQATEPAEAAKISSGKVAFWILVFVVVVLGILIQHQLKSESPPQKNDMRQIDIFLKQMEKVKTQFPTQRAELWNRSRIHLKKHLQTAQPTEPVSLILTSGLRAERTLHCLAHSLASAFSSALNASVLHIDGASKASQDSDQVKLDIDSKLQGAFEGDKPVAVIHRFEELPPGSTLIFYRYCDHENAAYKKTFLIFTVLLGEEEEIPAKIHLSTVEEMVDDHLQKKFLSDGHPVSFDRMDLDKYGGLWSRISHLILPVAAEERIEHEGC